MTPAAKRFILDQFKKNRIMSLATVRSDGYPQATTVTYANDGLTLYFACDRNGQNVRNLRRSPKVSLTINKDTADWKKITGLSMGATAKVLDKPADAQRAAHAAGAQVQGHERPQRGRPGGNGVCARAAEGCFDARLSPRVWVDEIGPGLADRLKKRSRAGRL